MKKIIAALVVIISLFTLPVLSNNTSIKEAYDSQKSDVQVKGEGEVFVILADDLQESKHQKFILRIDSKHTVLIAHNIDLAPRIENVKVGDRVAFYGEYEWNNKGGVVHWTHKDPRGSHIDGWLKHQDKTYQ
ncbi:DUF3465 domain-containing protein [Psychromonas sp. PT13]|uniref:DUF3465 domain-containing protein n=1 Tax=Psychromonas sp. PT13 TaxID=3439547 RepID=UPI003EBA4AC8